MTKEEIQAKIDELYNILDENGYLDGSAECDANEAFMILEKIIE